MEQANEGVKMTSGGFVETGERRRRLAQRPMWSIRPFIEGEQHWFLPIQIHWLMRLWRIDVNCRKIPDTNISLLLFVVFRAYAKDQSSTPVIGYPDDIAKEEAMALLAQILKDNAYVNWSRIQRSNPRKWIFVDGQRGLAMLQIPLCE
jgi:hypothetical protein